MLWEEDDEQPCAGIPDEIVDIVFQMTCRCLPLDHAHALSQAVHAALPWFADEPDCGLHLIHGAESGNGWQRPQAGDGLLYLSRRTRFTLRIPRHRIEDVQALTDVQLDIAGYPLTVGKAGVKPLSRSGVLFSRYVQAMPEQSEEDFLHQAAAQLRHLDIRCRKMLCGRTTRFNTPQGKLFTRSLMVADLSVEDAVRLQEKGLGAGRKSGCGLFIPHKDIKALTPDQLQSQLAG